MNELSSETGIEPEEYRLTVEVLVKLVSLPEGEILWSRKITEATPYSISSEGVELESIQTEEEALTETSRKIAEHLVNLTLEGWEE